MTNRPLALSIAAFTLTSCAHTTHPAAPSVSAQTVAEVDGLAKLRAATKPYRSIDSAVAVGYPRTVPNCLIHEHHGAMGYHHVNRAYVDREVDVTKPEILLYERTESGEYRLNGVEFIVPYAQWPRDTVPPVLMGRPMKHEDNLNIWYTHVWAWSDNPDGVFADFNPNVKCGADSKVFTPYERPPERPSRSARMRVSAR